MKKARLLLLIFSALCILLCGCNADPAQPENTAAASASGSVESSSHSSVSTFDSSSSSGEVSASSSSASESGVTGQTGGGTTKLSSEKAANPVPSRPASSSSPSSSNPAFSSSPAPSSSVSSKKSETDKGAASKQSSQATPVSKEAEKPKEESNKITITLSVDCKIAIDAGYEAAIAVSESGYILSGKTIVLDKDSSVYDALKQSGLVVGANISAMGTYVYSIQSLKEKACGGKSGWLYGVNGVFPSKSCSSYILADGDTVQWRYSCDNGNDL